MGKIITIDKTTEVINIKTREKILKEVEGEALDEMVISPRSLPLTICENALEGIPIKKLRVQGSIDVVYPKGLRNCRIEKVSFEGGYINEIDSFAFACNDLSDDQVQDILDHTLIRCEESAFDNQGTSSFYGNKITGKRFVITGALHMGTRNDVEAFIMKHGGTVDDRVTKSTDYLVTNYPSSATTKAKKARDYGIPIISEEQMLEMA